MQSPDGSSEALEALRARSAELHDIERMGFLVGWDQQVMMPPAGAQARSGVMETMERLAHERATHPALGTLLDELDPWAAEQPADDHDAALVRVMRRDYERASRVPVELATEIALAGSQAQPVWIEARATNDFALFAPYLERNLELRRRYAACFPEAEHPYDPLLDRFEPGMTAAAVRTVFERLRAGLVPLIEAIAGAPEPPKLPGPFPVERQREAALEIARSMGYDDDAWRLDGAVHPFASGIARTDVRVTTRYAEDNITGLFATMHEVGHGLYEAGVEPAFERSILGTGVSLGVHESQSRMWENLVGRSRAFWSHWYPRVQEHFPEALQGVAMEDFHRAINTVHPTLIRVEADEATYSLHVILRFELELALGEGSLEVADLPEAWRTKMDELLGIEVPDDTRGALQDIHWAYGEFGYFPTYALGNMIAAQLWDSARADLPDLDDRIAAGELAPLREWLVEHVHRHGRVFEPAQLVQRATGAPLDPEPFLHYLNAKYRPLYGLASV
jgi:carboxypeptidase Taq